MDGVVAGAFLSQEPWLQGGDSESFISVSPKRRQLIHHTPLPAAWSHCLEGSEGPWGSDGHLCPFKTLVPGPHLRVTPARGLEPRLPGAGEDLMLQKGSWSDWLCVLAMQQRCRGTLLSLGLGAEAHIPSLACWLLSWGAHWHRPQDPAHSHHPHTAELLPALLMPLQAGTGGHPTDPRAPRRPRHGHGPAILDDGCEAGEMVPAGSQAPGFRQGRRALCPQPADLPRLQPTASQSPAGPLCPPLPSLWACRGPVHLGLCPESPAPLPPSGAPGAPLSSALTRLGPRGSAAVCGFCGCGPPAPRLLNLLRAGTVSPWLPCNLDEKLRTPSKYGQAHRHTACGPRGCHSLTGVSERSAAGREPQRQQ